MSKLFFNVGGVAFVTLDHLVSQLQGSGITARGVRSLLASVGVPTVTFGNTTMVNVSMLQVALQAISRIGQPDFYGPACAKPSTPHATQLDPTYVKDNLKVILSEIVYARKLRGLETKADTAMLIAKAADNLVDIGLRGVSHAALRGFDNSARRSAVNDGLFDTDEIIDDAS